MTPQAKTPLVSVILTAYNRPQYLPKAIESILNQSLTDFELLILDDASPNPETREVAARYAGRDSRIRTVALRKNVGLARIANRGIQLAQGRYIAFQDDDDFSHPERLKKESDFLLQAHPKVGAVQGAQVFVSDTDHQHRIGVDTDTLLSAGNPLDTEADLRTQYAVHPGGSGSMMRRDVLAELGGFRPWFRKSEDRDLTLRILDRWDLAGIPDTVYYYRRHSEETMSHSGNIWCYSGTAFLCALYRRSGRCEPIGEGVAVRSLVPLFRELSQPIISEMLQYAVRCTETALNTGDVQASLENYRGVQTFADNEAEVAACLVRMQQCIPKKMPGRVLKELMRAGRFQAVKQWTALPVEFEASADAERQRQARRLRRRALKYSFKYCKPGYWFTR